MGGRGAKSSYGGNITTGDSGRPLAFYDKSDIYGGMTIQQFEKAVKDRKVEYVGLADENGIIRIAGTSNNKGAVAIPTTHPNFHQVSSLTHNHPYYGGRELGGSFSGADVRNHVMLGLKNTRAVSKEKTYLISQKKPTAGQTASMLRKASKSDTVWDKASSGKLAKIQKTFNNNGKKLTSSTANKIKYGYGTRIWKNLAKNSGYDYVEIKPKQRGF